MFSAQRLAACLRVAAILGLLLMLVAGAVGPATSAQDDEPTDPPADTETPLPAPEGALAILTAICAVEAEPPAAVAILTDAELAEQVSCVDGPPALVSLDGGDAFDAPSGTEVALEVGTHTLAEVDSGAARDVEIVEATTSTLVVTTFEFVPPPTAEPTATGTPESPPTETPAQEPAIEAAALEGSLTLVTHLCRQGIATTVELADAGAWGKQLAACPVVVLPDDHDAVTEDAVTANDLGTPLAYDQTVAYDDGSDPPKALTDGAFVPAALCEDDLGEELNGAANGCYDQSGYLFPEIPAGPITVVSTDAPGDAPDEYTFLIAKTAPDPISDDDGAIEDPGEGDGTVELDTDGDPAVTVHLFFAPQPIEDRVTIIGHLCPAAIESRGDFNALGEVEAKLVACQSITLPGDAAPSVGETAGEMAFAVTVQGADAAKQTIPGLPFAPATVCERDLPVVLDDDPDNDLCLDASGYVAADVLQGPIKVIATTPPSGAKFIAAELGPDPDAADAEITARGTNGLTRIDTTADGNVVVHVFFAPIPVATATPTVTNTPKATSTPRATSTRRATSTPVPGAPTATRTRVPTRTPSPTSPPNSTPTQVVTGTPDESATETPTPTRTRTVTPTGGGGGGTGTVKILKFVCVGPESQSRINVLEPGQAAGRDDLGDATCQNANIQFAELILADGSKRDAAVPPIGFLEITGIPATEGNRLHTFDDIRWLLKAKFAVEGGKQTILVSLTFEIDEFGDFPDAPDIPGPSIGDPPPLPDPPSDPGDPNFPEEDFGPDPVDQPADDPFGNTDPEDEASAEEVAADERAEAEVAKVDEGEDLPTVGTARASGNTTAIWLIVAGLGMVGAGLVTRRRRVGSI